MTPEELLRQRLAEAAADYAAAVGPAELAAAIATHSQAPVLLAPHPWLEAAAAFLPSAGPAWQFLRSTSRPDPLAAETLVSVGLGAIPETGTVLVAAADPQVWRLSLAVRRQLVVIPASRAQLNLGEALALTAGVSGHVIWLTGPSRTADIEKVLVLGAQGPRELVVIVYHSQPDLRADCSEET